MYYDSNRKIYRGEYMENGKKRTKAFKTKDEAKYFEDNLPDENKKPQRKYRKSQNKLLLKNIVQEFLNYLSDDRLKESTLKRYEQISANAIFALKEVEKDNKQINKLSSDDFKKALEALAKNNYSESTIKKVRGFYINLYSFALDKYASKRGVKFEHYNGIERLLKMPAISKIKAKKEICFLNKEEYFHFIEKCNNETDNRIYRFAPLYLFLLFTGMRVGELLALKWCDINFVTNSCYITKSMSNHKSAMTDDYVIVTTKNGKERTLTLMPNAIDALNRWKEYQRNSNTYNSNGYICVDHDLTKLNHNILYKDLKLIMKDCEIDKNITPHALRHTFATAYIDNYVNNDMPNIEKLSKYLGHSSVEVTRSQYVHAPEVCSL